MVITACEGREHLLARTIASFESACSFRFRRRILALDGTLSPGAMAAVRPDVIVQNFTRAGYVASIGNFLKQVDADAFFWLEDDWAFNRTVNVERLKVALEQHPTWAQVRLSKIAPLEASAPVNQLGSGFFRSTVGFSANPSLNRTAILQEAYRALLLAPRGARLSFESFITDWLNERGIVPVVEDPGAVAAIVHDGHLESTPRQYHMVASLDGANEKFLPGIPMPRFRWRRASMSLRLAARAVKVALRLMASDSAYEAAFRFVTLPIPRDITKQERNDS